MSWGACGPRVSGHSVGVMGGYFFRSVATRGRAWPVRIVSHRPTRRWIFADAMPDLIGALGLETQALCDRSLLRTLPAPALATSERMIDTWRGASKPSRTLSPSDFRTVTTMSRPISTFSPTMRESTSISPTSVAHERVQWCARTRAVLPRRRTRSYRWCADPDPGFHAGVWCLVGRRRPAGGSLRRLYSLRLCFASAAAAAYRAAATSSARRRLPSSVTGWQVGMRSSP